VTVELVRIIDTDQAVLDHIARDVVAQVQRTGGEPVEAVQVRALVEQEWARHDDARVRTFLPVLVRRAVFGQIIDQAQRRQAE